MTITTNYARPVRLAFSPDWSTWTPAPDPQVREIVTGLALAPGVAMASVPWGVKCKRLGDTSPQDVPPPDTAGWAQQWCRIEEETTEDTWTPRWWGRVVSANIRSPSPVRGVTQITLKDLREALHCRRLTSCYVRQANGSAPVRLFRWPRLGTNMAPDVTVMPDASEVVLPVLPPDEGEPWIAGILLQTAIALSWPSSWPPISLTGDVAALNFFVEGEVHGMALDELLNWLAAPDRGLAWSITGGDTGPVIRICSLSETEQTIGDYTLPASTLTTVLDAALVKDLVIDEDYESMLDEAWVTCDRRRCGITVDWVPAGTGILKKGWGSAAENTWSAAFEDEQQVGELAPVYHRLVIDPQWDGLSWDSADGLRHDLDLTNGTRAVGSVVVPYGGHNLELTIPAPAGADLTIAPPQLDGSAGEVDPKIVVQWATTDFEDVSAQVSMALGAPGEIWLGRSPAEAELVRTWMTGALRVLITLTASDWAPIVCAPTAFLPTRGKQAFRSLTAGASRIAADMVAGTDGATLIRAAGGATADQTAQAQALAARLMANGSQANSSVSWWEPGLVANLPPGTLITGIDNAGLTGLPTTVITQRIWRQRGPGWVTIWSATIIRSEA